MCMLFVEVHDILYNLYAQNIFHFNLRPECLPSFWKMGNFIQRVVIHAEMFV